MEKVREKCLFFICGKMPDTDGNTYILVNFVIYKRKNVEKYRTKV